MTLSVETLVERSLVVAFDEPRHPAAMSTLFVGGPRHRAVPAPHSARHDDAAGDGGGRAAAAADGEGSAVDLSMKRRRRARFVLSEHWGNASKSSKFQ